MRFIPLDNFKNQLRYQSYAGNVKFKTTQGLEYTFMNNNLDQFKASCPFFSTSKSNTTAPSSSHLHPYASTAETIASDIYQVPDSVGTATVSVNGGANGWTETITIAGTSADDGKKIRHLVFVKQLYYGSSMYSVVIFALKLDTPVELNAENNYTASFTFAIDF